MTDSEEFHGSMLSDVKSVGAPTKALCPVVPQIFAEAILAKPATHLSVAVGSKEENLYLPDRISCGVGI